MTPMAATIRLENGTAQVVNTRMGVMYKGDYERLSKAMAEARVSSEVAHRALIAHITEHGC